MRWTRHVARIGERRGAYRFLVRRPKRKRLHGRRRRRTKNNTKMDRQAVGWGSWTGLIWFRIGTGAGFCEGGNKPSGSIKCGEFLE
jgi:hypothetical protein